MKSLLWSALLLCTWPAVLQETAGLVGERGQASRQLSLAENHFLRGENQKALETYRKAREIFLAAGDPLGQGHTWKGEADVLFRLGDDRETLDAYRRARELFLAADDRLGQGETWRGEAKVLFRLGEEEEKEAREACETARQLHRAARQTFPTGDQLRLGRTWYGEAEILYRLSDKGKNEGNKKALASPTQALYGYRKARQLYLAAGDKLGQGNAWRGEADVLLRLRDTQKALDAYRKARQIFMVVGDYEGQGDTWIGEAEALKVLTENPATGGLDPSKLRKAKNAAAAAITAYQSAGVVSKQITTLLLKAEVEAAEREADAATARGIASQTAFSVLTVGSFSVGASLVPLIQKLKKPDTRSSEEAIRLHGIWRETGTTDAERTQREGEIRAAYDFLVTLRARQKGSAAEALRLAEEARSRVLLDLLATPPASAKLTPERKHLETEISQIEEQLRGSPALEQQEGLRVRRLQLELQLNTAPKKPFPQEPPLNIAAIQDLARDTGPLLVYYVAELEVWGFLILPEATEIELRSITISRNELQREIDALRLGLANPITERDAASQAYRLWDLLIHPFLKQLPKSGPLVIVPHGPLHELPFEALRDAEAKRLFERWQVSVTPSVSALAFARRRHSAPLPGDFFLGLYSGRGLDRPKDEVTEIFGFFGTGKTTIANYPNYKELVAQARHLLISTRGQTEKGRAKTYLEIDPTPDHDSHLTAAEIATIPLQAELVTLAACDTSYGPALDSDERLDVTRSFLIAGAAALLAARWRVPESEATSQFLADFYQAYRQGGPQGTGLRKDEALTEARRRSRERGDPAQVWAGWVLIGDPR